MISKLVEKCYFNWDSYLETSSNVVHNTLATLGHTTRNHPKFGLSPKVVRASGQVQYCLLPLRCLPIVTLT
jgi:hypothetical protein